MSHLFLLPGRKSPIPPPSEAEIIQRIAKYHHEITFIAAYSGITGFLCAALSERFSGHPTGSGQTHILHGGHPRAPAPAPRSPYFRLAPVQRETSLRSKRPPLRRPGSTAWVLTEQVSALIPHEVMDSAGSSVLSPYRGDPLVFQGHLEGRTSPIDSSILEAVGLDVTFRRAAAKGVFADGHPQDQRRAHKSADSRTRAPRRAASWNPRTRNARLIPSAAEAR